MTGRPPARRDSLDAAWLKSQYQVHGLSLRQVAALTRVSYSTVRAALLHHGIPLRPPGLTPQVAQLQDAAWLRRQYHDRRLSTYKIAARLNITAPTVRKAMIRHGIPRRDTGDPNRQADECSPSCKYRDRCLDRDYCALQRELDQEVIPCP